MESAERRRSRERTRKLFQRVVKNVLYVAEKLSVSEWAEKYRILDESSNFKGRWNNDITPYLKGVMDAFDDPYIQEINFVKSTQVGGTEAMFNMLGSIIMQDPAPTMVIYPTDELAKDISSDRLKPSLIKTPEIKERFIANESKELKLKFRGMSLYLRGAGSPSKLSSKPIKYLFFDEIDKMEGASKKEASPYNLAKERTRTYTYDKKIYTCSTPTLKTNYIWQLHEKAEAQRNYFMPCAHCGEYIVFKWKQVKFPDEEGMGKAERAKHAVYVCEKCGCQITGKDKTKMLRKGEWRDVEKKCIGKPKTVSFWINALYSPFLTWEEIVKEFLKSKDDPEELQNFVNSWLAEPWEDTKIKTNAQTVMDRQTELAAYVVPEWTKLLTGGVDVQENCLYWTIRAWGDYMTSQNLAHGQAFSFGEVERIMNAEYEKEEGSRLLVSLCLVDSGNMTDIVYDFCATNAEWSLPCKGASNTMIAHYKLSSVNKAGSRAFGMNLVLIDTGKYKDMIAGRMRKANGTGAWMVHKDCDTEYAEQLTAEHKISERKGGVLRQVWVLKKAHADNHYLDTEVYAACAADILGVRTLHLIADNQHDERPKNSQPETPEENWIGTQENWLQ